LFNPGPTTPLRAGLSVPGAIFASQPNADAPSKRPLHTVGPLATDLNLPACQDYGVHQEKDLVAAALQAAPAVLICWYHERIKKIAAELSLQIMGWDDSVFDRVLVFDSEGQGWKVSIVQQHLLPGDS